MERVYTGKLTERRWSFRRQGSRQFEAFSKMMKCITRGK